MAFRKLDYPAVGCRRSEAIELNVKKQGAFLRDDAQRFWMEERKRLGWVVLVDIVDLGDTEDNFWLSTCRDVEWLSSYTGDGSD